MKFLFNKKISFTLIFFIFIFLFFILQIKPVFAVLTVTQNYFRWYSQKDAADPGDPWPSGATDLAENEAIGLDDVPPGSEDTLRIRMSLYVYSEEGEALEPGMTEFKLQWAAKDGASCSGEGEAWSALDAGAWIGHDNETPNDGDPIDRGLLSVTDVAETYEERNNASIQNPINSTEDGEWDWSIRNASAIPNTVYCFRMVYLDDAPLDGYDYYPELTTEAITVSGTVYTDEGSTNIGADKTIVIKVNGADKCNGTGACTAETNASGQYSISNLDIDAADDVLTVFIDEETENATTVTKANNTTADITGLNLYQDRIIVRHEGASAITNADLAQYDDDQDDDDIRFDSDNGALTVYNDTELHIWTGDTFSPGGAVTTNANLCSASTKAYGSNIHIDDNAVFIAGGAISVGNNWAADAGSTFTHNNNTVTFTATGGGCTIAANSQNFYDVTFNGSGGGWSFSSTTTISNDLTMTAGTLSGTSDLTINGGDATGDGTINLTADSTFTLDGTGNFGGATAWTFNTLTFGDGSGATTTTATGSGGITASKALIISANQTLDAGSKTWTLSGTTGTPFVKTGTFTANSSTFSYTGNNSGGNTTIVATTYNHLIVNNGSETYVLSGETSLNGDLTITAGTLDVTLSSYALNVKGSFTTTGAFQARAGVVTLNGTSSGKTIGAGPFYDLTVNGTGGQWTVTTAKLRINNDLTITAGTLLDSNNLGVVLLGSLSIGPAGYFTKGSGDFTFETAGTETWTDGNLIISQDLGNVVLAGGGTLALASSVKCTSVDIQGANIFDLKNHTFTITGSGTGGSAPLKITDGTLTLGTSTINYSSGSDTHVISGVDWNYYNLTLSGAGPFTIIPALVEIQTIDNNLTISGGPLTLGSDLTVVGNDVSISGSGELIPVVEIQVGGSWTNSGTFTSGGAGTVNFTATAGGKTITAGSSPFFNLSFTGVAGKWTMQDALNVDGVFNLTAGNLVQAANANINFGGNVLLADGATFTKASGSGLVIFDGTGATFTDNSSPKQNLGNVHIGTSPDDLILCSDKVVDSLTINAGDTLYLNQWDIDVTNEISVVATGLLDASTDQSGTCAAGDGTAINLETDWSLGANDTFKAGTSVVTFDGAQNSNIDVGGSSNSFYDLVLAKDSGETVTIINNNIDIDNDLTIGATSVFDVGTNYNINIGGSWANSGTFTCQSGTVTFDSTDTGETIDSGGNDFYAIVFNNAGGGWTIQTNNIAATNFTITNANTFVLASGRTATVTGTFTNSVGGAATTWTGSTLILTKTGGGSYTINTKSTGADAYATLQVGANTDIRMWNSSASTYTIDASGSLYSMDHGATDGALHIWGDYHVATTQGTAISTWTGLNNIRNDLNGNYYLTADLTSATPDYSGIGDNWTPIPADFEGTFHGNGHTIEDLIINEPAATTWVGLFRTINSKSTINNVGLIDVDITGNTTTLITSTGSLVGSNEGTIVNSYVSGGTVQGKDYTGGLTGNIANGGSIINCYADVEVIATGDNVGGLDGGSQAHTSVINSYAAGDVSTTGHAVGGLLGEDHATVTNSYAVGNVSEGDYYTGGLVAYRATNNTSNSGWNTGSGPTYAIAYDVETGDGLNVTYNEADPTVFYDKTHNLYDINDPYWDFTNIWQENGSDYPTIRDQSVSPTDYWSYYKDFDGTYVAGRQVKVYLNASGATNPSVTVDAGSVLNVMGGGAASGDITIVGQDASADWNFNCTGTCNVQESTWNYLNLTGGTLTLNNSSLNNESAPDSGTLNVDWYLGDYVVDQVSLAEIDTGNNDVIISENSGTPQSTVFKWYGANFGAWGGGATSQTTGTESTGKIPQIGTDWAIKIREYARTSAGFTYYKYNIYIDWQGSSYGEYDYYRGYGDNYITSTLNTSSGEDECISEYWQRNDIDVQNSPTQAINDPPPDDGTSGTWYNGMLSGLIITVAAVEDTSCTITGGTSKLTTTSTTIPFSSILAENFYDACQSLQVSTSASNGYIVTIQELDQMTAGSEQIADGTCDGGCSETVAAAWDTNTNNGFAYCMDDQTGTAANIADSTYWTTANQCGGGTQSFKIIPENDVDSPDTADIMKNTGPAAADNSFIGFRLSVDATQPAGVYSTTIIYVVTANY